MPKRSSRYEKLWASKNKKPKIAKIEQVKQDDVPSTTSAGTSVSITIKDATDAGYIVENKQYLVPPRKVSRALEAYISNMSTKEAVEFRRRVKYYNGRFGSLSNLLKIHDVYGTMVPTLVQLNQRNFFDATDQNGEPKAPKLFAPFLVLQHEQHVQEGAQEGNGTDAKVVLQTPLHTRGTLQNGLQGDVPMGAQGGNDGKAPTGGPIH